MTAAEGIDLDARYTVAGFGAVAFYVEGPEVERYWDLDEGISWEEPEERETGMMRAVMVGDDRVWVVDPSDLTKLGELDYCAECGQVGCAGDGRDDRTEDAMEDREREAIRERLHLEDRTADELREMVDTVPLDVAELEVVSDELSYVTELEEEHERGAHADTLRGDCPLCAELTE